MGLLAFGKQLILYRSISALHSKQNARMKIKAKVLWALVITNAHYVEGEKNEEKYLCSIAFLALNIKRFCQLIKHF